MALSNKKDNRICIVCGEKYTYCNHCGSDLNKPSWYTIFHDQNCHDIYDAVANILPLKGKEAAKESLDKLDLSNKSNFHPNIVKAINEIYNIKDENESGNINKIENIEENKAEEVKVEEVKEVKKEKKVETEAEIKVETEENKEVATAFTTDNKTEVSKTLALKKNSTVTKTNKNKK